MPHKAYKVETEVLPGGKIELTLLPIAEGSRVEVLVLAPDSDDFQDLTAAAASNGPPRPDGFSRVTRLLSKVDRQPPYGRPR